MQSLKAAGPGPSDLVRSDEPVIPRLVRGRTAQLTRALRDEVEQLEGLRAVLARQRRGVAANDPEILDASVRELGRALLTLDEARRGRQALVSLLRGEDGGSLSDLESWFPGRVPQELIAARDAIFVAAASAESDLALNQDVLDGALQAGDAFLQCLFSGHVPGAR
jgi:hypothetical protein